MVDIELDNLPRDSSSVLRLKHDPDDLEVIRCRGIFEAGWDKNFHEGGYLFAFDPTPVFIPTGSWNGIHEPSKSLVVAAVDNATLEHFVVVNTCGIDCFQLAAVLL